MLAVSFHSVLLAVLHVSFTVCTIAAYQRLNLYLLCSIFAMMLPINSRFRQYFAMEECKCRGAARLYLLAMCLVFAVLVIPVVFKCFGVSCCSCCRCWSSSSMLHNEATVKPQYSHMNLRSQEASSSLAPECDIAMLLEWYEPWISHFHVVQTICSNFQLSFVVTDDFFFRIWLWLLWKVHALS